MVSVMRYGYRIAASNQAAWWQKADIRQYPTKYAHRLTCERLGIWDDVQTLVHRVQLEGLLLSEPWISYAVPTIEFMYSVATEGMGVHGLQFRLCGHHQRVSYADIAHIFGFPEEDRYYPPAEFNLNEFWEEITDGELEYDPSNARATHVRNPVFRYILRMYGVRFDYTRILMEQFLSQAAERVSGICIGGLITPIARHLRLDISQHIPTSPDRRFIDVTALMNMRILRDNTLVLRMSGGSSFPLPNPALTHVDSLENRENWKMDTEAHLALMFPAPGAAPADAAEAPQRGQLRQRAHQDVPADVGNAQEGLMWAAINAMSTEMGNLSTTVHNLEGRLDTWMEVETARNNQMMQMFRDIHGWGVHHHYWPPPPPPQ